MLGGVSIKQREAEQSMLTELIGAVPPQSAAFFAMLKLIVQNGTYNDRPEIMAIIDTLISQALNPPPPPPDLSGEARIMRAKQQEKEHEASMFQWAEELKRKDLEMVMQAKDLEGKRKISAAGVMVDVAKVQVDSEKETPNKDEPKD